ncbi:MAG: Asp-tRNA(Asn)/Glu-tRNA(Gln) amidotransferase subunit GatA [Alphaproteobacteria bacterium]|nr:Asp-tRNA(Asn)/Glu-tRNA(Gln) amidotransferase subunit GatA [Alphaproteobacteria bacterium]
MTDLTELTLSESLKGLEEKKFSSVELTNAYLKKMEEKRHLNAYITETPEHALEMAKTSDERRSAGTVGKLEGAPLAIKDMFCTKGIRTTAASRILSNFVPEFESTTTQKLWDAGAVCLGKTNTDEFAMGSSTITSYFGVTKNPHDETRVPGGSSGGSAAAVAAHLCTAATGTETGGSIRHPASFCQISGFKPTYGRCSRYGVIAYSSSLDQPGVLARSVEDCARMIEVMMGHDEKDSTSSHREVPNLCAALDGNIKGMKIGLPREYQELLPENWENALQFLKDEGAELIDVDMPHTEEAGMVYYVISQGEATTNLARYDGVRYGVREEGATLDEMYMNTRMAGFGQEVRNRMILGTFFTSAKGYHDYFVPAQKMRSLIKQDFDRAFEKVDVLFSPAVPIKPFTIEEAKNGAAKGRFNDNYLMPSCLTGVPAGCANNGLQVIGRMWDDATVLKVLDVVEKLK